ncbi:MAG: hypothetical protein O4805_15795 [Trichodesmium sp. St16_bin2-tuft]|nr:hypothetical protein [Trichodesmium sp. St16_bin2-tuft]MDE5106871.1 hypothetical protein [Trichodesmium sp. St17_bin3_1_1]MDE5116109.1 hypothetical protein [Trichodesmium sp. St2_bin2_1]
MKTFVLSRHIISTVNAKYQKQDLQKFVDNALSAEGKCQKAPTRLLCI